MRAFIRRRYRACGYIADRIDPGAPRLWRCVKRPIDMALPSTVSAPLGPLREQRANRRSLLILNLLVAPVLALGGLVVAHATGGRMSAERRLMNIFIFKSESNRELRAFPATKAASICRPSSGPGTRSAWSSPMRRRRTISAATSLRRRSPITAFSCTSSNPTNSARYEGRRAAGMVGLRRNTSRICDVVLPRTA